MFDIFCTDVHFDSVCTIAYSGHLFWGDFTKAAITIASVDRFYSNLVIFFCKLGIVLLSQNPVKI